MTISELPRSQTGEHMISPEKPRDIDVSFGRYLPKTVLTNKEIESWGIGISAAAIQKTTGIKRRHIAQDHETQFFMAAEAMQQALGGRKPKKLIVSTSHPEEFDLAECLDQEFGFGLNPDDRKNVIAACSGAVLGLSLAGEYGADVLLVATEKYSDKVYDMRENKKNRNQAIFGDYAGAMYMPNYGTKGHVRAISPAVNRFLHPKYRNSIQMATNPNYIRKGDIYVQIPRSESGKFEMEGRLVLEAIQGIPSLVRGMLRNNMMKPEDIDYFVFHQGSGPVVETIIKGLGEPFEGKVPRDYEAGNNSSASVIKVLDKLNQEGKLLPGSKVGLHAVGAGLYTSNQFYQFGEPLAA